VIDILVDYNIEGQARLLWSTIQANGLLDYAPIQFMHFADVNLPANSNDRVVWRFAQERGMLLLTGNRNMKGANSLEATLREELTADSLPVLTISDVDRLAERAYRERCAYQLFDIVLSLDTLRGTPRLYIPTSA
jgi:hypothetical protein